MKLLDVVNAPWAIMPDKLNEISQIYATHLRGEKIDIESIKAKVGRDDLGNQMEFEVRDGVAIIPIEGVLGKKMNMFMRFSGGSSTQIIKSQIEAALNDDEVSGIILNVDSPGGTVDGTTELAEFIFESRGKKPIVSFVDGMMASAAYYIGAAADRVLISGKTAILGSIGIVTRHVDVSTAENNAGMKTTEITAGKFKRIDSSFAPLSEEGRDSIKAMVNSLYSVMVTDIAKYRGVAVEEVLENMADGRIFIGEDAISVGLVDGVCTIDALVKELSGSDGDSGIDNGFSNDSFFGDRNKMNDTTKNKEITIGMIEGNHPSVFAAIKKQGLDEGQEVIRTEALKEGADAERERIQAVEKQTLPGHENLIASLKFDGKTSGPEAAVQVLNAEKAKAAVKAEQIESDSPEAVATAEQDIGAPDNSDLPVEERAKAAFDSKPELRAEFGTLGAYTAYLKHNEAGDIKIKSD